MIIRTVKYIEKSEYVDINPGDKVELLYDGCGHPIQIERRRFTTVRRITIRSGLTYVVFDNHTWRPVSSYGRTWKKVEE